jgi:hypothetical protein
MPLDSAGFLDPLVMLGITPVPKDLVDAYKANYRTIWLSRYAVRRPEACHWRTVKQGKRKLETFLASPMQFRNYATDQSAAPAKLIDLALRVQTMIPDAEFSVDYFDRDPVLNVTYEFNGKQKACLGIWDEGKIKAIAKVA